MIAMALIFPLAVTAPRAPRAPRARRSAALHTPRAGRCWAVALSWTLVLALLTPVTAWAQEHAGIIAALNAARAGARCTPAPAASAAPAPEPLANPAAAPLKAEAVLDAAAAELARTSGSVGRPLTEVLQAAGYRATRSMVIQVSGAASGAALARFIEQRYCTQLASTDWQDIGLHQRSSAIGSAIQVHTWVVLASRFTPPADEDAAAIGQRVLELVNRARGQARSCGSQAFAAAGPLKWNALLARASQLHAADMATHSYFSHDGRDGSVPAQRATRAGYVWRATGENIAGGQTTAEAAVQGWIDSPPHCANLMGAQFAEMGVAFSVNARSKLGIYWTQMFGTPR